jgi:hypothetical protein
MGHDYPPSAWTVDGLARALRPDARPLATYDDADVWERTREDDLVGPVAADLLEEAAAVREKPVPYPSATEFLDYERTGERGAYGDVTSTRRRRLALFALAECIEREGAYLDPVLDYAWAICEESTWEGPPHFSGEGLPYTDAGPDWEVSLRSALTALNLAELDALLGERLHDDLRARIRDEVEQRVIARYEDADDYWWLDPPTNNWSAVCHSGVVGAAVHLLDDRERVASLVVEAADRLRHYLDDFDADGCTAEGIGYWNYGFGNYTVLAQLIEAHTGGEYSLLSPPVVREIARYPLRVELRPGLFLPFSDATARAGLDAHVACWLGERLELPALSARGRRAFETEPSLGSLVAARRELLWTGGPDPDGTVPTPPRRRYFSGYQWWIARHDPSDPDALAVAAKGGHNDESHNHNDCGTFVVHLADELPVTDLGSPEYDRDFFSDRRYDYLAARSLGHPVPHVNGHEQAAGREYAAEPVDRVESETTEAFEVDLAGCYPEAAGLETLRRRITLDRDVAGGRVSVTDRVAFREDAPGTEFASVLISSCPATDRGGAVVVEGERAALAVEYAPASADATVEHLPAAVRGADVWRTRIEPEPARERSVELSMTPGGDGSG